MSRDSSSLALFATLVVGIVLGVALDRGGPFVSAQATRRTAPETASSVPTRARDAQARGGEEEALYQQLERQYAQFEHVNQTFELVAKAVSPAVVHIVTQKTSRGEEPPRIRHYEETGSGVVARGDRGRDLYVLTNNHVIEGAKPEKISIFLQDGRSLHPDRVWFDVKADIAVLNLGRDDLPAARLGDSDEAAVGTWVLAMGSPFGLTHSVSQGIISARGRHVDELQDVENQDFLQTDAAINPGNSGGPLVNMKGEVIGINNSIASNGGGNEGVGFSIPINLARWIMNQLVSNGRVARGALGIDLHPEFRPEDAQALGLGLPRGAWVDIVRPGSPAFEGGMRGGDVIVRFRGKEIHDLNQLINEVSMAPIGQPAEVVVWRGGRHHALNVRVGDRDRTIAQAVPPDVRGNSGSRELPRRPDQPTSAPGSASGLGLLLATMDEDQAERLGLPGNVRGVVVTDVQPGSELATYLKPNDVIALINSQPVRSAQEAVNALSQPPVILEFDRVVKGEIERRSVRIP
ncbi:MAG: trypsin-like peptidase domain-containing protein [Planctomycetaceae bacterium]|nr:trypsin-like peptidase domain-containing protein [Planctomycetaceae bacterium]MBV8270511.1 trypsin-like peptidase domain-containing protein [Planctomycetaceae bacterium]MBV8317274.1 trypsin-like peptidase domain-containing protein [Planctomycetaceae bacterium]MBV8382123.1 trypsin-like peptidase domain-containing protein [Planctomycetaceae bacterium]